MSAPETPRSFEVLAVGYSSFDAVFLKQAFRESPVSCNVKLVESGRDARQALDGGTNGGRPDVILLALDTDRPDSRDALAWLKSDESTRRIPLIVMTASDRPGDRAVAYDLHANCFIPKPASFDQFVRVVHSISRFWFSVVTLPRE
jgi:CheY-like chemotaxis protein